MATFPSTFSKVQFQFFDENAVVGAWLTVSDWIMSEEDVKDIGTYFLGLARARPGLENVVIYSIMAMDLQASIDPPA